MTKEDLLQRIANLDGWMVFYDLLIEKIKESGSDERHGGFPLDDPHPDLLGMPSISKMKPLTNPNEENARIFERCLERSAEREVKILTLNSWKEELREQQKEFRKKLEELYKTELYKTN